MEVSLTAIIVAAVYLLQCIELVFFPLPSEVSTYEIIRARGGRGITVDEDTEPTNFASIGHMAIAIVGTIISVIAFLVPGAILVFPSVHFLLYPLEFLQYPLVFGIGTVCMIIGSALTLIAVLQISRFKSADRKAPICRSGLYRFSRHPISAGLVLIMIGFLLRFSSLGLCIGTAVYILNVHFRTRWEEKVLLKRLGEPYRRYMEETGRLWPKIG